MAGPIRIAILSNGRQARADIARTANSLGAIQRSASRATKVFAGVFAVASLTRAAAAVGRVGASYVDSLNKIQALTGSTDQQMGRLADRLESQSGAFAKFGQTTGDAAQGMVELAKSGLSAQKALAAVRGTMTLAKAGELEVADASELVANTLNTFNLRASKATKIANSLANAANISSADVRDVAESFKYVAPLAAKANVSVDQTNALLAELANSGIKASQAGTSLRKFLLSLQAPTGAAKDAIEALGVSVYDAEGNMRPISSLIGQLREGLSKLSAQGQNKALRDIFGLTGITGAQVILKGGVKGLRDYTEGVKRAGAATKLAESASKGLAGTLGSIKAQAISTTQSLYRQYSPALDARIQSSIGWLRDNQDQMVATAKAASDRLIPALKALVEWDKNLGEAFADTAVPLAKALLPAVGELVGLATKAVSAVNDLPGPVKEIGVQAAIAALVLPRLTAGVTSVTSSLAVNIARLQQWRAEMTYSATRAQLVSTAMTRLGGAAKTAAGIGGLVALTQSAQQANTGLSLLSGVAGGAALGFSMGGPWGALVGGAGGGLISALSRLGSSASEAGDAAETSKASWAGLADTLDSVTGATTAATRAFVYDQLQRSGVAAALAAEGISRRTAIAAVLGEGRARQQVQAVLAQEAQELDVTRSKIEALTKARLQLTKVSSPDAQNYDPTAADRIEAIDEEIAALERQRDAHKKTIQTIQGGIQATRRDIAATRARARATQDLSGLYRTLPKRVVTQLEATGINPTVAGIARVAARYKLIDRKQIRALIQAAGVETTVAKVKKVQERLEAAGKVRADMGPFKDSVRDGTGEAAGLASRGGNKVGNDLQAGIMSGFAGTAAALAAAAANAVRQAVAAARAAGRIHSPSKETEEKVGAPLAQGIVVGFLKAMRSGSSGIQGALDKILQLIEKRLDGKKQAERRKALLKSLRDERAALLANGKAQDQVNKKLEKAEQRYKALRDRARDYAKSIRDSFVSFGAITELGKDPETGAVSLSALLEQLKQRVRQAQQFNSAILQLRNLGLNETSINQLLSQGPDALASAQAILSGGSAAVAQINTLAGQLAAAGAALGEQMRLEFYGHGLEIAEGFVDGLEKRKQQLERTAELLAEHFLDQVKEGLTKKAKSSKTDKATTSGKTAAALPTRTPATDAYMSTAGTNRSGGDTARVETLLQEVKGQLVKLNATEAAAPYVAGQALGSAIQRRGANVSRRNGVRKP